VLGGTTRLRAEAIGGQARAGFDKAYELINLRTTLVAQYRDGAVRVLAELWDSRGFGDDGGTPIWTAEVNALELVQASGELKALFAIKSRRSRRRALLKVTVADVTGRPARL
jgi:hypothetical protein